MIGLLWFIKPEMLKNRIKRKMTHNLKRVVFGFVIVFGLLLVGSVMKASGIIPKIIGVIGIIIVVKGSLLITGKASDKLLDWWGAKPIIFFRIWAACVLAIGIMLVLA